MLSIVNVNNVSNKKMVKLMLLKRVLINVVDSLCLNLSLLDRIMFPEVPIALRMSGHLLLGVVRIYSKKVDYLFHDCNLALNLLRKAFHSIDLNLPEDARKAPVQSITLPETFDLDALELNDEMNYEG